MNDAYKTETKRKVPRVVKQVPKEEESKFQEEKDDVGLEEVKSQSFSEAEKIYFDKMLPKFMDRFRSEFYKQKICQIGKLKKLIGQQENQIKGFLQREKRSLKTYYLKHSVKDKWAQESEDSEK